jgi:hypothetical protein
MHGDWRGAGGDRNSPEWGCCIVDRWQRRLFFTHLTLIYTGLCTTTTSNIHCVWDLVWQHLGWRANFNSSVVTSDSHLLSRLANEARCKPDNLSFLLAGRTSTMLFLLINVGRNMLTDRFCHQKFLHPSLYSACHWPP